MVNSFLVLVYVPNVFITFTKVDFSLNYFIRLIIAGD